MSRLAVTNGFHALALAVVLPAAALAADAPGLFLARPGFFKPLTEPPCSYCSTQNRKGLVRPDDRVVAWIRGEHHGGAIPLRHFLAAPRVINDTYGLFFYDPDGGYVSAFAKDKGFEFHGWRRGVTVVKGRDGTLWSALSGRGIEGPQAGQRLERLPSFTTDWGYWLMLHPESTAYDLFDGRRYPVAELPAGMSAEAKQTMGTSDARLPAMTMVLGVELGERGRAFPIDEKVERACWSDTIAGEDIAVFWYGATRSAVAFRRKLDDKTLTFYADADSPDTAPFKDQETGTRWTLAGRSVDGSLQGKELTWARSVQCRWYAWAAECPQTSIYTPPKK